MIPPRLLLKHTDGDHGCIPYIQVIATSAETIRIRASMYAEVHKKGGFRGSTLDMLDVFWTVGW